MVFDAYAAYYDLLYKDKNYKQEALYVHQLIKQHSTSAETILDLGCGTGRHANEFSLLGYSVNGVDISDKMISIAEKNYFGSALQFHHADIREVRLQKEFDVVVALFHVMCYQTTDQDLLNAFETASVHLKKGGLFIFDCWYGPGVINDPPVVRTKVMNNEKIEVERIAKPSVDTESKIVNVDYEVQIKEKSNESKHIINENHKMRYLFRQEVEAMAELKNFKFIDAYEWLQFESLSSNSCWNVAFVLETV